MVELKRSCENCGNARCANSFVAYWWDECVKTNFESHWMPLPEPRMPLPEPPMCDRPLE